MIIKLIDGTKMYLISTNI